jgi:hypothetical protein
VADGRGDAVAPADVQSTGMEWPFDETGEFRGQRFEFKDFTGTTIRESRLNSVRLIGVEMIDAEIDGYVEHLTVNGVDVMPLVEAELDRLHPERLLMRSDDPTDLRAAWAELVAAWQATIDRAATLTPEQQHEQVGGEWSITQTLRHLVFVVDAWLSRAVLGAPMPYHPAGQLLEFMDGAGDMGIDIDASPSFDDMVAVWHGRSRQVADFLADATAETLARVCEPNDGPLWPPIAQGTTARRCVGVVLNEVWAHHRFAIRDLQTVEGAASDRR